jgi:hypothetical protein
MVFPMLPALSPSFYVHLCSGAIDVVAPADSVSLDATTISLMNGDRVAASYARRDVFFCCREVDALPSV